MTRTSVVAAALVLTAVLVPACGTADQSASSDATDQALATTSPVARPTDAAEHTSEAPEETSPTTATPTSAEPTSVAPTSEAAAEDGEGTYPQDSIGYARAFLAAWAAQQDSTVAELAGDEVTHGTDSWGAPTGYGDAWSCGMDHLGADWTGHDLVMAGHPGLGSTDLVVRRSALGGPGAVVGVNHTMTAELASAHGRPETELDAYAREFVEAWMRDDLATMTRLSDPELADRLLQKYPADPGRAPVWAGFQAMEDQPFYLVVDVPITTDGHDFRDVIGMDAATVLAGEPHGVVDANFIVDPIYSGVCGGDSGPVVTDPAP